MSLERVTLFYKPLATSLRRSIPTPLAAFLGAVTACVDPPSCCSNTSSRGMMRPSALSHLSCGEVFASLASLAAYLAFASNTAIIAEIVAQVARVGTYRWSTRGLADTLGVQRAH